MRTEINKKRGRPSERSEEARAKGAKRGNNSWRKCRTFHTTSAPLNFIALIHELGNLMQTKKFVRS